LQELWGTEAATPKVPTTDLEMQLEILRTLRSLQRGRTDAEDEECDVEGGGGLMSLTGASEWGASGPGEHRKLVGIRRLRRRWMFQPFAMIREYLIMVRDRLGIAHESLPWHMRQYSVAVRAQFGRCLGLWRVHHGIHEVLDLLCLRGDTQHAVALLVQLGKATHQAALDGGSWGTASLLLPTQDPVSPPRFAGTAQELAAAASYKEGLAALHLSGDAAAAPAAQPGDESTAPSGARTQPRRKAKAKEKGKDKDKGEGGDR